VQVRGAFLSTPANDPLARNLPEAGRHEACIPTKGGQSGTASNTKPMFVYGTGLDWGLLPHLGLRLQYRGNLYKAPDLTTVYTSTGAFTHTAEPMLGVYFRL